jgi:hypothetical protein
MVELSLKLKKPGFRRAMARLQTSGHVMLIGIQHTGYMGRGGNFSSP